MSIIKMKKDCNETPEIIMSLGQALKDARLAVPLSIDEVAEQLNLSLTTVRDIENDLAQVQEDKKYPTIYLRGYLSNYAKLVGLQQLDLFAEYQQLSAVQNQKKTQLVSELIIPQAKKRSKLLPLSLLFLMVASAVFYFSQQQSLSIAEQPAISSEPTSEVSETSSPTINLEVKKRIINTPSDDALEIQAVTPKVVEDVEAVKAPAPIKLANVDTSEVKKNPSTSKSVTPDTLQEVATATVILTPLALKFSADCWTEVFDATGKRVAYGLYKKGRALTLSGVAPFQLKLGDPSVVEIQYKDQVIEGDFTPGRTANFTVPLS